MNFNNNGNNFLSLGNGCQDYTVIIRKFVIIVTGAFNCDHSKYYQIR